MYVKIVEKYKPLVKGGFQYNISVRECDSAFVIPPCKTDYATVDDNGKTIQLNPQLQIILEPSGFSRVFYIEEEGTQIFLMNDNGKTIDSWYIG